MTIRDLDVTPINNYVLVKPNMDMESTNSSLKVDTTFDIPAHACRTGKVIAIPKGLDFDAETPNSMPWDTDMELMVGDEIVYHYLSAVTAEKKGVERFFEFNGEKYYFIKYDRIFTAKRLIKTSNNGRHWTEKIICLNGYILVEPVQDQNYERYKGGILSIPKKQDKFHGIVRHIGSRIRDYGIIHRHIHLPDDDNISVGDLVIMDKSCDIPLEFPMHASVDGNSVFYRVQRRYILGKVNK